MPNIKEVNESEPRENLYPMGLLRWAGHRSGGVRKPFQKNSGRPNGQRIATPLVNRLNVWVNDIVANKPSIPRNILLVGGPGNGKTDAVESCIEFLDEALGAEKQLIEAFAFQYAVSEEQLPPRKVTVELSSIGCPVPHHLNCSITLVQDATEGDPTQKHSAEELLLAELNERLNPDKSGIYLCCVNRGILAHAATIAEQGEQSTDFSSLLNMITAAVTSGPTALCCWPLSGYEHFGIWPMDVESLVDSSIASDGQTVAHQIFRAALDESKWVPTCAFGSKCPFCRNRQLLSKDDSLNSVISLLRYYELASGKRWTFRDLFSLVPYLLIGDHSELEVRGKPVSPCDWAAHQHELIQAGRPDDSAKARAPYHLVERLYYHRLFPRWPSLDRGDHRKAKAIFQNASFSTTVSKDFYRFLAHSASPGDMAPGEIAGRLRNSFSELLDPALARGDTKLFSRGNEDYSVNEVEELFSLSVQEGFNVTDRQLEPLEKDLLRQLIQADEALIEENFPRTKAHQVKLLQSSLRQFCARLVKRSIGARRGICRDLDCFELYEKALHQPGELLEVRRQLRKLLHDDRNRFRASLVTTFGQPLAQRSRDIVLLTRAMSVKEIRALPNIGRPPEQMPYIRVDKQVIPLTFSLFKALREVVAGLHDASLPAEIFALLNGIKSLVSGRIVRDDTILEEDSRIELGDSGQGIEIVAGKFHFTDAERQ
jgi:hypothetical protein